MFCTCFFHATSSPEIYTLSLHDALPISLRGCSRGGASGRLRRLRWQGAAGGRGCAAGGWAGRALGGGAGAVGNATRSEEHTSELQSHSDLVCRLLLEKKK